MNSLLPSTPGTKPIPKGYVRLYHQTQPENVESILSHGIQASHGQKREGTGGPQIFADENGYYGKPGEYPTIEFAVPKERWYKPIVSGDVAPENILAVHLPWHLTAAKIEENPQYLEKCLAGEYDHEPELGPAVAYIKQKNSRANESLINRLFKLSEGDICSCCDENAVCPEASAHGYDLCSDCSTTNLCSTLGCSSTGVDHKVWEEGLCESCEKSVAKIDYYESMERQIEALAEKYGLGCKVISYASTGSRYYELFDADITIKVRVSDHATVYKSEDISISPVDCDLEHLERLIIRKQLQEENESWADRLLALSEESDSPMAARNRDEFYQRLKIATPEQKQEIKDFEYETNKAGYAKKLGTSNPVLLFHGSPHKSIDQEGLKITKGQRSGFLGATKHVDNLGIFMTDSMALAHNFGSNRAKLPSDYKVYRAYANLDKMLDLTKTVPAKLARVGLDLLATHEGKRKTKIAQRDLWWLLDQPEFVDTIKSMGFTAVKFKEDADRLKEAQDKKASTIMILDPKGLIMDKAENNTLKTLDDLWAAIYNRNFGQ